MEFTSPTYVFRVDVSQTGFIGRVEATTKNGESLIYSIQTENGKFFT